VFPIKAETCPHCGFPLLKTVYSFVDVFFNGNWMEGEQRLNELLRAGWTVVDQRPVVEWEEGASIDITKYKLQKKVRSRALVSSLVAGNCSLRA
jgi:hypothetical protein